jgi:very-short-patch-repair endonuclease
LDGAIHDTDQQQTRDEAKEADMTGRGLNLIRFQNEQVLNELDTVLNEINQLLHLLGQSQ